MNLDDLKNKMVAVLNYGQEGRAVTKYLTAHGLKPVIFDSKPWQQWSQNDQDAIRQLGLNFVFGKDYLDELRGFDAAFRSPGLWRNHPRLLEEETRGLQITSQTKWFFEHCPAVIIGVTGTKGKGTTSALIADMLKQRIAGKKAGKISIAEKRVYLTGNIGQQDPFDFLDELALTDLVVFELSSFQLQDLDRSPNIAVVLMITSEHLDTHASLEEYAKAKQNIVRYQQPADSAVINLDYAGSAKFTALTPARKYFVSQRGQVEQGCHITPAGEFMAVKLPGSSNRPLLNGPLSLRASELKLKGRHNWDNVAAALTAALIAGGKIESIIAAAKDFTGLSHRLELAGRYKGISFYDDSLSTIPESTIAAINAFSDPLATDPLIIILGGSKKKSDYNELAKSIIANNKIKALILIGAAESEILQAIDNAGKFSGQILTGAKNMTEIFKQIIKIAQPGDVVLLSPACASYGMFRDYADRGNQFKRTVVQLQSTIIATASSYRKK